VAHEFAGALQETSGIGQGCALEESDVDVRGEHVDIGEGGVSEAGDGAAVMEEFPDFVAAVAHDLKPVIRDGSQFAWMLAHPGIDGGIMLNRAVEAEESWFHELPSGTKLLENSVKRGDESPGLNPHLFYGYSFLELKTCAPSGRQRPEFLRKLNGPPLF